jgi:hypothetical protein
VAQPGEMVQAQNTDPINQQAINQLDTLANSGENTDYMYNGKLLTEANCKFYFDNNFSDLNSLIGHLWNNKVFTQEELPRGTYTNMEDLLAFTRSNGVCDDVLVSNRLFG